ncbi:hypothetical protein QQ045_022948 [Rhodiola kirilowii]
MHHRRVTSKSSRKCHQGVPLGIGLKAHFDTPNIPYMRSAIDTLAAANVPIWITELDVASGNQEESLKQIINEAASHPAIKGIIIWAAWKPNGCYEMCLTDNSFNNYYQQAMLLTRYCTCLASPHKAQYAGGLVENPEMEDLTGWSSFGGAKVVYRTAPGGNSYVTIPNSPSRPRLRGVVFDMDGTLTVPVIDFLAMSKDVLGEEEYLAVKARNPSGIDILHQIETLPVQSGRRCLWRTV